MISTTLLGVGGKDPTGSSKAVWTIPHDLSDVNLPNTAVIWNRNFGWSPADWSGAYKTAMTSRGIFSRFALRSWCCWENILTWSCLRIVKNPPIVRAFPPNIGCRCRWGRLFDMNFQQGGELKCRRSLKRKTRELERVLVDYVFFFFLSLSFSSLILKKNVDRRRDGRSIRWKRSRSPFKRPRAKRP